MPSVHAAIQIMESLVPSMVSTGAKQHVADFVRLCKEIMQTGTIRESTGWVFVAQNDVDESGDCVYTGACYLYGVLVEHKSSDSGGDFFVVTDNTSNTLSGTAVGTDDIGMILLPATASDGVQEFHSLVFPEGYPMATGITVASDGTAGTNPDDNDVRCWVLYRT